MSLGIGVIGAGEMGRIHAEHLASRVPGAHLAGIADLDPGKRALAERLGVPFFADDRALIADPNVGAIVIATLRATHASLIEAAAAGGRHVFCEKPLAASVEEADAAIAAAKAANVVLQVGFQRRFDASFREVRRAIVAGEIGEPRIIHSTSRDPAPASGVASRAPADLILETTIHDIDMIRHVSGSEVTSVHSLGLPAQEAGRLEGLIVTLELASGAIATIDNHLASAFGYDQRVEVFGSGGMASVCNETAHRATVTGAAGATSAAPRHFFAERYDAAYTEELAAFVRAIADGTPSLATGADGRASLVVAFATLESLREGRPVTLR